MDVCNLQLKFRMLVISIDNLPPGPVGGTVGPR